MLPSVLSYTFRLNKLLLFHYTCNYTMVKKTLHIFLRIEIRLNHTTHYLHCIFTHFNIMQASGFLSLALVRAHIHSHPARGTLCCTDGGKFY